MTEKEKHHTAQFLKRYFNRNWISTRTLIAYHAGKAAIRGVETGRIHTKKSLVRAMVPVYLQMNLAWNGRCSSENDLRRIPWGLRSQWEELPLSFWNHEFLIAVDSGLVYHDSNPVSDRNIPIFLKEELLFDLREGVGGLDFLSEYIMEENNHFMQLAQAFEIELAHSYRHLNSAINFALNVSKAHYQEDRKDEKSMKLFHECSRWPEAIVRNLGPEWVADLKFVKSQIAPER